jgi:ADP-ribosylglycohydrolase
MDYYDNIFDGCLIGYVVGDALGSPLEFSERDTLNQITEMETNYLYDLPRGCWTDKTSQMLCMANSIVEQNGFTYDDFLVKYHQFVTNGYLLPCNNKHLDIGYFMKTTGIKIGQFLKYRQKLPLIINPNDHHQVDCEPIFRVAPIVLKYYYQPTLCMTYIEVATALTHISRTCVDACKFYASLMIGALMGVKKETLLSENFNVMDITTYGHLRCNKFSHTFLENCHDTIITLENDKVRCRSTQDNTFLRNLFPAVTKIQKGSYKYKKREEILSDNNILDCIEAALWSFYMTNSFEDGCVLAVNLGLSANSIGAIYGQLAGIYYGATNIPDRWASKIYDIHRIKELNSKLK